MTGGADPDERDAAADSTDGVESADGGGVDSVDAPGGVGTVDAAGVDPSGRGSVSQSSDPPSVRGLVSALVLAVRSRPTAELLLVSLPLPAVIVALALLPGTDAWRLSLAAGGVFESRWTLWTAFASSFVHTTPTHLVDNVVNYWLLVAMAYPLSVIAGWRRRFLLVTLVVLAVVPLASAWVTLAVLGDLTDAPAAGFSDVNSALLGYLVVVWFAALATERSRLPADSPDASIGRSPSGGIAPGVHVDARWSIVAVFGSLAVVFAAPSGVAYFPTVPAVGALFAVAAAAVGFVLFRAVGRPRVAGLNLPPSRELLYVTGASVAIASLIGSLIVVPFGSNVYAHLVGYVVGSLAGLVAVVTDG